MITKEISESIIAAFKEKNYRQVIDGVWSNNLSTDARGNNILHLSILYDMPSIILFYIDTWGISATTKLINQKNSDGDAPIHFAIKYSKAFNYYLFDVQAYRENYFYFQHQMIMHKAAGKDERIAFREALNYPWIDNKELGKKILFILSALGADVNIKDAQGNTPLHLTKFLSSQHCTYRSQNYSELNNRNSNSNSDKDDVLASMAWVLIYVHGADDNIKDAENEAFRTFILKKRDGKDDEWLDNFIAREDEQLITMGESFKDQGSRLSTLPIELIAHIGDYVAGGRARFFKVIDKAAIHVDNAIDDERMEEETVDEQIEKEKNYICKKS
ncbi:MAG: hypothetical protein K0R48_238 [Gammaproteobacteria bacterium]|jgi:hypothetical protein|nr:hypothetical protein [Gammaproteobacteria bacterium]